MQGGFDLLAVLDTAVSRVEDAVSFRCASVWLSLVRASEVRISPLGDLAVVSRITFPSGKICEEEQQACRQGGMLKVLRGWREIGEANLAMSLARLPRHVTCDTTWAFSRLYELV